MRKKLILYTVLALLLLGVLTVNAKAVQRGSCGTNVSWTLTDDGVLTVFGSGSISCFSEYDDQGLSLLYSSYFPHSGVESVVIKEGVTGIESYAFKECQMKEVTIPSSVKTIERYAFQGCFSLKTVSISGGSARITSDAFSDCKNMSRVNITDLSSWCSISFSGRSANPLGNGAALYLNGEPVEHLVIPADVTSIGTSCFSNCEGLTEVTIPSGVTFIGEDAFGGCPDLKKVNISSDTTEIMKGAFSGCKKLTDITIPDSVTRIGDNAFSGCAALTEITIPDSVTDIGEYAFAKCEGLKSVKISSGIKTIPDAAFQGCKELTEVNIPDSVQLIAGGAFSGCTGLTKLTIPDSVTRICSYAFSECTSLTEVTLPKSLLHIGYGCFNECTGLKSLTVCGNCDVEASNTSPRNYPFYGCTALESVQFGETAEKIGKRLFSGCESLREITIPPTVKIIGEYAFSDCTGLTSLVFQEGPGGIDLYDHAFENCTGLTEVTLTRGWTSIGNNAFGSCRNLTDVVVAGSLGSLGEYAFKDSPCQKTMLQPPESEDGTFVIVDHVLVRYNGTDPKVEIPEGVTCIGPAVFKDCGEITEISIPDGVRGIGDRAFQGCFGLREVVLPDSVGGIGDYAFSRCTGLTKITIPEGVTRIGISTFSSCESLQSVSLPEGVTEIDRFAFFGCGSLSEVVIPVTVTSLGESAFVLNGGGNIRMIFPRTAESRDIFCDSRVFSRSDESNLDQELTSYYIGGAGVYNYADALAREKPLVTVLREINPGTYIYIRVPAGEDPVQDVPVSGITLDKTELKLFTTGGVVLKATVLPENASDKTVTWTTSDPSVAVVEDGFVGAVGEGTAVITAAAGDQTAACTVKVSALKDEYILGPLTVRNSDGEAQKKIPAGPFLVTIPVTWKLNAGDALVVVAAYTEEGQYKSLMYVSVENATGGATANITLPVKNEAGDIAVLKAFAVPSFNDLIPLGPASVFPAVGN